MLIDFGKSFYLSLKYLKHLNYIKRSLFQFDLEGEKKIMKKSNSMLNLKKRVLDYFINILVFFIKLLIIFFLVEIFLNLFFCLFSLNFLLDIIILLLFFILFLCFIPRDKSIKIKQYSLTFSIVIFILTLFLWIFYNGELGEFSFVLHLSWLKMFNIYYSVGIDGISIFFIILTAFLIPICILASWESIQYKVKEFMILLLITEFLLINVFIVLDLFFFYIFFEGVLIPMFLIIGLWGSRQRKIHAAYQFFFFTLLGSIIMLLGIIIIYVEMGTSDIQVLMHTTFTYERQLFLWFAFFCSFAVKVPMIPVHIWLPEAHVEAPTAGSVILAGILLKLGVYGIIRILIPMFPDAMIYFTPLVFTMCIIGIIYSAATTIRQIDLKKTIAYSSVAHMNYAMLGLFTNNSYGIEGCLYFMLGHGVVSSALFLCIGMLYDRYHTRNILYYGGLVHVMPLYSIFFLIFVLANIGLPGTVNFIGEFLVMVGVWRSNTIVIFFGSIGMILGAVYAIWMYNRIVFGL